MRFMGFQLRIIVVLVVLLIVLSSAGNCLAKEDKTSGASFFGSLLNLLILLVLVSGIILSLNINSLFKGGELSSTWVLMSLALSILFVSIFMEFLGGLGVINNLSIVVFLVQIIGFFVLVFGLVLLKKKLS